MKLANLMAHEDADTVRNTSKKSHQGVKDDKEGKARKKRSLPQPVSRGWDKGETVFRTSLESSSGNLKLIPELGNGMSDAPSKRLKINTAESEYMHLPNQMKVVLAKAQDVDEDYDNI